MCGAGRPHSLNAAVMSEGLYPPPSSTMPMVWSGPWMPVAKL
jgi:hypothetical protein